MLTPQEAVIAADKIQSWIYTEEFAHVSHDALDLATVRAQEFGLDPLSPGTGSTLRMIASLLDAHAVAEIGTGTGVSGLWLLQGMNPDGILTTIDGEAEHQRAAKEAFTRAGVKPARTRTINGRAYEVLPRLADAAYDLVYIDAMPTEANDYTDHALRILRRGGALVVSQTLWHDRVADPARRDEQTVHMRELSKNLRDHEELFTTLLPVGGGLTIAIKR